MKPRFPESDEARAARLMAAARRLAPDADSLESAGVGLPATDELARRIAARLTQAGVPPATARPLALGKAQQGRDVAAAAARGSLRADDLDDRQLTSLEAVIRVIGRPAWPVRHGVPDTVDGTDAREVGLWLTLIGNDLDGIRRICARVGLVSMEEDGRRTSIGTGWTIGPGLLATNAHVADHLYFRRAMVPAGDPTDGWRPKPGVTGKVDFRAENGGEESDAFLLGSPCFIEADEVSQPDLAILAIVPRDGAEPPPAIPVETSPDRPGGWQRAPLFAVGHPITDLQGDENVAAVFGDLDGTKRFSPGEALQRLGDFALAHDCSTVNGSSGSPVIDFASLRAVGLHYFGQPGERNEAVLLPAIGAHPALARALAGGFAV